MNTKNISINELVNVLLGVTTETRVEITAETVLDMNKNGIINEVKEANPYHEKVMKRKVANAKICFNYSDEVNDNRAKEGKAFDFVPKARKWGVRMQNSCLITHNNAMYMEAMPLATLKENFFYEGVEIDKTILEPYMKSRKPSAHQDLDKPVIVNDFKLPTIKEIVIGDTRYIIQ